MTSTEMNHTLILHHVGVSVKRKCVVGDVSGKSLFDLADVVGGDFDTQVVALESVGDGQGGAGTGKGIEDQVAGIAGHLDNPFQVPQTREVHQVSVSGGKVEGSSWGRRTHEGQDAPAEGAKEGAEGSGGRSTQTSSGVLPVAWARLSP
jgi:hypothetical protein